MTRRAAGILLAGLVIREAFSFWTGHPYDFEVWIRTAHAVATGANPYTHWPPVPGVSFSYLNQELPSAAYLPFWPLLTGGLYRLWMGIGSGNRFVLYFLLKQPSILFDVLDAYLLYRLVGGWTGRLAPALRAMAAWSFFPYAILISAVWGQFDAIVLALILTSLAYRDSLIRCVLDGWGIFIKWLTFIYLPFEFFAERGWRRWGAGIGVVIPIAATFATFAALGWGVTNLLAASASQSHGGGGGMNWVGILTSGPLIPIFSRVPYLFDVASYLWVPGIVWAGYIGARWVVPGETQTLLRPILLVTVVFLLLRFGLYEQYLIYLFGLGILDLSVEHSGRRVLYLALTVVAYVYLVFNNDFLLRFITPVVPALEPYLIHLDASPIYGVVRTWALIAAGVLVTLLLIQFVWTVLRNDPVPHPWIVPWRVRSISDQS
ncbi:MAG: hypothetical protein ACYCPN_05170 [Thermoplasmata archaeon]